MLNPVDGWTLTDVSADRSEFIFIVSQCISRNSVTALKTGIFSRAALETSNPAHHFLSQTTARYVGHPPRRSLILHNAESTYICDQLAAHYRYQILFHGIWPEHNAMNTCRIMAVYFTQLCVHHPGRWSLQAFSKHYCLYQYTRRHVIILEFL